jgi:galactonate dehydratase
MPERQNQVVDVVGHAVPVSAKSTWILIEVTLADGTRGVGEATDFGNEFAILEDIRRIGAAIGRERPAGVAPTLALLDARSISETRRIVRNGLEQALLDAQACQFGVSVAAMLGGPHHRDIAVYANINRGIADRSPTGFAARAREVVAAEGHAAIKIAPFDGVDFRAGQGRHQAMGLARGIERILAVREAIGPQIGLQVDCHNRLDPVSARQALTALQAANLFWFEDPLPLDCASADQRALRHFANDRGVRIAGGEHVRTLSDLDALIAGGGTDVVLPDLRLTGIADALAMGRLAVARGQAISLHNPVGPVLDAVSRQVAALLPGFLMLERQVGETLLWHRLGVAPAPARDGRVETMTGHGGWGVALDRAALAEAAAHPVDTPLTFAGVAGAGGNA